MNASSFWIYKIDILVVDLKYKYAARSVYNAKPALLDLTFLSQWQSCLDVGSFSWRSKDPRSTCRGAKVAWARELRAGRVARRWRGHWGCWDAGEAVSTSRLLFHWHRSPLWERGRAKLDMAIAYCISCAAKLLPSGSLTQSFHFHITIIHLCMSAGVDKIFAEGIVPYNDVRKISRFFYSPPPLSISWFCSFLGNSSPSQWVRTSYVNAPNNKPHGQLCVPEMPKNVRLQWRTHNEAGPTENREGDRVDAEQVPHGVVLMRWFILCRRGKRGGCVLLVHLKRLLAVNGTQMNSFCDAHTTSSPRSSIATEQEQ